MAFRIPTIQELDKTLQKGLSMPSPTVTAPKTNINSLPSGMYYGPATKTMFQTPQNHGTAPAPAPAPMPATQAGFDSFKYADDPTVYKTNNAGNLADPFSSADQFLAAGGDWNRINVIGRPAALALPSGQVNVDPATGMATKSDVQTGLIVPPMDTFTLDDLRAGANSPTSASAITTFLENLTKERTALRTELAALSAPTQAETDLETALTNLRGNADLLKINTQAGAANMQAQPIPQKLIEGQQGALYTQSQLALQTMATQEQTLLSRLGIEQTKRTGKLDAKKLELEFLNQDSDTFFKAQSAIQDEQKTLFAQAAALREDAQNIFGTIIDKFQGLDLEDLDANTQNYLATIATKAGIPFQLLSEGMRVVKNQRLFENNIKQAELMKKLTDGVDTEKAISIDDLKKLSDLGINLPVGSTYGDASGIVVGQKQSAEALGRSQELLTKIDNLLKSPGLNSAVGPISARLPTLRGKTADFEANFAALQSMMALENLNLLKGPMSDKDIQFIKEASSGLNLKMSQDGFRARLQEIKGKIEQSIADDIINQTLGGSSDTLKAPSTGMRTDRHNNPAAFTTDIAKQAGLVLGKDYEIGDAFPNNPNLKTAKLLGDPIAQTIKVIDKIGFYTQSGKPRWSYVPALNGANNWKNLNTQQKKQVIAQMYQHEGGSALKKIFA